MMKLFVVKLVLFVAAALVFKNVRAEPEKTEEGIDAVGLKRRKLFIKRNPLELLPSGILLATQQRC